MKQKFCLFILFTAISLQSFTQTKWTLEDCINYAHENNLQVKAPTVTSRYGEEQLHSIVF